MRFEEAYGGWRNSNLTQLEAAKLLGVCERTFRRYINRYDEKGLEGLFDKIVPIILFALKSSQFTRKFQRFDQTHMRGSVK